MLSWIRLGIGGLIAALTRSILSSEEDNHGAAAKEEASTVSDSRGFRRADSLGVPNSQRNASLDPISQPRQRGESRLDDQAFRAVKPRVLGGTDSTTHPTAPLALRCRCR